MSKFTWGTITGLSPLRVKIDGDAAAVPITADTLVDPATLTVTDRVRCELTGNKKLVVVGRYGGDALSSMIAALIAAFVSPEGFNIVRNARFRINQRGAVSATSLALDAVFLDGWKSGTSTNATSWTGSDAAGRTLTVPATESIYQLVEQCDVVAGTYRVIFGGTATVRVYNVGDTPPTYAASGFDVVLTGNANVRVDVGPGTISWIAVVRYVGDTPTVLPDVSYSDDLLRCQRYYEKGSAKFFGASAGLSIAVEFKATKRAAPTMAYGTATSRSIVPTSTEWAEVEGFGVNKATGSEVAFTWTASAEL